MNNLLVLGQLDQLQIEQELKINEVSQAIIQNTFDRVVSLLNSNLSKKLPGFVIQGETPYFNDGEDCVHSVKIALPAINASDKGSPRDSYESLEYSDIFEKMFSEYDFYKNTKIRDSWDYANAIDDGLVEPLIAYETIEETEIAEHGIMVINSVLERLMKTNYIAAAKLQEDDTYSFTFEHYEPDY